MPVDPKKWVAPSNVKPLEDMTGTWPSYGEPTIFPWHAVDGRLLCAAFHVLAVRGYSMMVGTAMGGRGLVLTLYGVSKQNPKRYALGADELHILLHGIIDQWGSKSEDLGQVFGFDSSPHLAAD